MHTRACAHTHAPAQQQWVVTMGGNCAGVVNYIYPSLMDERSTDRNFASV